MQDLDTRGLLLLMPLFATHYCLVAIVLVKVRGRGAHRRLGSVEIQIKSSSFPKDAFEQNAGMVDSPALNNNMMTAAASPAYQADVIWNKTALKLITAIIKSPLSSRIIDIF